MPLFDRKCDTCKRVSEDHLERGEEAAPTKCVCGGLMHRDFGNSAPKIRYKGMDWHHSAHEIE